MAIHLDTAAPSTSATAGDRVDLDELSQLIENLPGLAENGRTVRALRVLVAEVAQLRRECNVAAERMRTAEYRESLLKADNERLRAVLDEIAAEDDE